jgi:hypothetical protein
MGRRKRPRRATKKARPSERTTTLSQEDGEFKPSSARPVGVKKSQLTTRQGAAASLSKKRLATLSASGQAQDRVGPNQTQNAASPRTVELQPEGYSAATFAPRHETPAAATWVEQQSQIVMQSVEE